MENEELSAETIDSLNFLIDIARTNGATDRDIALYKKIRGLPLTASDLAILESGEHIDLDNVPESTIRGIKSRVAKAMGMP